MTQSLTTSQVWKEIENNIFATLGFVTSRNEARTAGIVYIVQNKKIYISTETSAWKTKHIQNNPHVSLTIPIAKSIPLMPWIKIPAATITFSGRAKILSPAGVGSKLLHAIYRDRKDDPEVLATTSILEVTPEKDFITYGVGVSLMDMRDPGKARGRVAVSG